MGRTSAGQGALAVAVLLALACPGAASAFSYDVPVQAKSPWPEMRRDSRNTASSPIHGRYRGDRPWKFATKRGIFSTPVIGGDDTIYVEDPDGGDGVIAVADDRAGHLHRQADLCERNGQ
jgi:outer membrane protein assembly factor BamB